MEMLQLTASIEKMFSIRVLIQPNSTEYTCTIQKRGTGTHIQLPPDHIDVTANLKPDRL